MNRNEEIKNMNSRNSKRGALITATTLLSGIGMWILAGLWHNLIMPILDPKVTAHHDGLFLMLVSYFILSFLMVILYLQKTMTQENRAVDGLAFGLIIGVLWVFPHGLAMAGAHDTSIMYEIKNTCWHFVEQGIGGITISVLLSRFGIKS
jgi:hypothetical protein